MRNVLFLLVGISVLIGCSTKPEIVSRPNEPDVLKVSETDSEMNDAIAKARSTLDTAIEHIQSRKADEYVSIKVGLPTSTGSLEHIWVDNLTYANGEFKGLLGNEPLDIPNLKSGDPVTFKRDQVSDWMIEKNGKFQGGYTVDVLSKAEGAPLLPR